MRTVIAPAPRRSLLMLRLPRNRLTHSSLLTITVMLRTLLHKMDKSLHSQATTTTSNSNFLSSENPPFRRYSRSLKSSSPSQLPKQTSSKTQCSIKSTFTGTEKSDQSTVASLKYKTCARPSNHFSPSASFSQSTANSSSCSYQNNTSEAFLVDRTEELNNFFKFIVDQGQLFNLSDLISTAL